MIIDTAKLGDVRVLDDGQILTFEISNAPAVKGSQGEDDCIHVWGERTKVVLWLKPIDEMVCYRGSKNPEPNLDPRGILVKLDTEGDWSWGLKSFASALGLEGKYDSKGLFMDPRTGGPQYIKGRPLSKPDSKGDVRTNIRDFKAVGGDFIPPAGI